MKVSLLWDIEVIKSQTSQCLWDLSVSGDGLKVATVGAQRVYIFSCIDGALLHSLKGHSATVVCCDFSSDSKLLASGSLDKSVIVWNEKFKGILKFTHNGVVTCLRFNPTSACLLSASVEDFALWSAEENKVVKTDLACRATCVSWTHNGQNFAIAHFDGTISIRDKKGEQQHVVDRTSSGTVWSIDFTFDSKEHRDIMAVVDWSRRLSLYYLDGSMVSKTDKLLEYDACFVSWYSDGQRKFLLVGGSDGKVNLHTNTGYFLMSVVCRQDWVWQCRKVANADVVVTCGEDGRLTKHSLQASQVHSFYKDRYAYRDRFTDVMVCLFTCDKRVRIRSRELVKKVAVYKNVLLIQHTDLFFVYTCPPDNPLSTQYQLLSKVHARLPGNIIMLCSQVIISVVECVVEQLSFEGVRQRAWWLESQVRYVKVLGGAVGREAVLLGLKDGKVMMLLMDNPFAILLLHTTAMVKGVSLNADRSKIAVVDEHNTCIVYDAKTKQILLQEPNASSVCWHESIRDLLTFTFNGILSLKFAAFPIHQQMQQGFVLSFSGRQVTCLVKKSVVKVAVAYSALLYQCLQLNNFSDAYTMATLGVSDDDWRYLGDKAMQHSNLQIAKKAYVRIRDVRMLAMLEEVGERVRRGERVNACITADILALQGDYSTAAQTYVEAGMSSKALEMFTDLKLFHLAKDLVGEGGGREVLLSKHADWAQHTNDSRTAVEMYVSAGEIDKAIQVAANNQWSDLLVELSRKIDRGDRAKLLRCAECLAGLGEYAYACDLYEDLADWSALLRLRVKMQSWEEGVEIVSKHPELCKDFYLPYALHLAEQDLFEEAQAAFHQAGMQHKSIQVLERLSENAVSEKRYGDASYFYLQLHRLLLELASHHDKEERDWLQRADKYEQWADIYYAYEPVQKFMEQPFTYHQDLSIFNMCRYLLHRLNHCHPPPGVSKVYILYTLAKKAKVLEAFKLVRQAYSMLSGLVLPSRLDDVIRLDSILIKAKPFNDAENLLPICYHCSSTNPLYNKQGNRCLNCKQPFIFSFIHFELLPLVEFRVEEGITESEARSLLELEPTHHQSTNHPLDCFLNSNNTSEGGGLVSVGRHTLQALSRTQVIITKQALQPQRYFKLAFDDVPVAKCPSCLKMFHKDDYELLCLQLKRCPFCRAASDE